MDPLTCFIVGFGPITIGIVFFVFYERKLQNRHHEESLVEDKRISFIRAWVLINKLYGSPVLDYDVTMTIFKRYLK